MEISFNCDIPVNEIIVINRVLIVCTGNICRSPMAEGVLKSMTAPYPEINISSAGIHALVGRSPEPFAQAVTKKINVDISGIKARQCVQSDVLNADIVLCMEELHRQWIYRYMPAARGRVFMLGKWYGDESVPDPYLQDLDRYQFIAELLEKHCVKWLEWIASDLS